MTVTMAMFLLVLSAEPHSWPFFDIAKWGDVPMFVWQFYVPRLWSGLLRCSLWMDSKNSNDKSSCNVWNYVSSVFKFQLLGAAVTSTFVVSWRSAFLGPVVTLRTTERSKKVTITFDGVLLLQQFHFSCSDRRPKAFLAAGTLRRQPARWSASRRAPLSRCTMHVIYGLHLSFPGMLCIKIRKVNVSQQCACR